jgi:hypothetical protein
MRGSELHGPREKVLPADRATIPGRGKFFLYNPSRTIPAPAGACAERSLEYERRKTRCVSREIDGQTIDVSMEGALLAASRPIPVGSPVNISLHWSKAAKPVVALVGLRIGRGRPRAFVQSVECVGGEFVKFLQSSAGPADFDPIDFRGGA